MPAPQVPSCGLGKTLPLWASLSSPTEKPASQDLSKESMARWLVLLLSSLLFVVLVV